LEGRVGSDLDCEGRFPVGEVVGVGGGDGFGIADRLAVAVLVPGVGEGSVLEEAAEAVVGVGERLAVAGDAGQAALRERTRVVGPGRGQRRVGIAHGGHPVEGVGRPRRDDVAGIGLRRQLAVLIM